MVTRQGGASLRSGGTFEIHVLGDDQHLLDLVQRAVDGAGDERQDLRHRGRVDERVATSLECGLWHHKMVSSDLTYAQQVESALMRATKVGTWLDGSSSVTWPSSTCTSTANAFN